MDLSLLSYQELLALREEIRVAVEAARTRRSRRSSGPIYFNPANPSESWGGSSQKPRWLKQLIAQGIDPRTLQREGPKRSEP